MLRHRKTKSQLLAVKMLAVISLLLITVGLFELAPRYEAVGPSLLKNGVFKGGLEGWTVKGAEGAVSVASGEAVLKNNDPSRSISIRQKLLEIPEHGGLQMSAEVSTENVQQGRKSWHDARVYLVNRIGEGDHLRSVYRSLANLSGDNAWHHVSAVFTVPDKVKRMTVVAQLARATGIMKIRNLHLIPVQEYFAFRGAVYVLLAAWIITLGWIGGSLLRNLETTFLGISVVVVTLVIAIGVLMPGLMKEEITTFIWIEYGRLRSILAVGLPEITDVKWGGPESLGLNTSKIAHFFLFLVLAVLIWVSRLRSSRFFQFIGLLIFAGVTEVVQYFADGREPTIHDWLFDVGGIVMALALVGFFGSYRRASADRARTL